MSVVYTGNGNSSTRPKSADKAAWAASRGWAVVKVWPGTKITAEEWGELGYRDPETVRREWTRDLPARRNRNSKSTIRAKNAGWTPRRGEQFAVGILTEPSGLVYDDLDVDSEGNPAGEWSLEELICDTGHGWDDVPPTFELHSPSGGRGLLWKATLGRTFKQCAGQVAYKFDVRGNPGMFVLFDTSQPERFVTDNRDPVLIPAWLAELHPEAGDRPVIDGKVIDIPSVPAWVRKYGAGEPCEVMSATLDKWLAEFDSGIAHEVMIGGVYALVGDRRAPHTGLGAALDEFQAAFREAVRGKTRENEWEEEWSNALKGAIAKKFNGRKPRDGDTCDVGDIDDVMDIQPIRSGLVKSISGLKREMVRWLWPKYLAFHEVTQMDGEKGQGKTFITDDVAARATLGLSMPGCDDAVCDPINVLILTDEGHAESTVLPRLEAAGADLDRVFIPDIKVKRGKAPELLLLPGSAQKIGDMIRASGVGGAGLVIWDPITDFLDESVQTHNDASVRRALRPMAIELHKHMCAGLALRHMNQNRSQDAKYRGSGSSAFQNRARVHLITGEIPAGFRGDGQFGLAMVDNNITPKVSGALAYSIVDSGIQGDDQGNMVGRVEWHGLVDIDANTLTRTDNRPGPEAHEQNAIRAVLKVLFDEKDSWWQKEVIVKLKRDNCSTNEKTLEKVKRAMGIRSVAVYRKTGGVKGWAWTISKKNRLRESDIDDD